MTSKFLENIHSPADLKKLNLSEMELLAKEIRQRIIEVMSVNGGHLASNLGSVELTLALHYLFDSPNDKIVWDTGHQSYTHKLLTGRKERFHTIRKDGGLCGFTDPMESPHDLFYSGHAGTALSQALGLAASRDLQDKEEYIITVAGDAPFGCGLTLEALNNMSRKLKRFIVVLNDNNMSISRNVGRVSKILSRMISGPTATKVHQEIDHWMRKIPKIGERLSQKTHHLAHSLKHLVSPALFFESFGFAYIGPIDGHDLVELVHALEGVKDSRWPLLIHTVTRKGEGLDAALNNPTKWHGAKPFDKTTCKLLPVAQTAPTFPKVFGQQVEEMGERDKRLAVVTPAMSAGSCLDSFMERFPERCFDVGIAEGHAVTFAGGLAKTGDQRVICSVYSTFLQRAYDNIFHDVCLQGIPLLLAIDRAGIAGGDGVTHNGLYDIGYLKTLPNIVIAQPRNGRVLRELLGSAFSWGYPTAIRYPNLPVEEDGAPVVTRLLGKGELLREGSEILLVGLGHKCYTALEVAEQLEEQGIQASVVDPLFVKPLDKELFRALLPSHRFLFTIEEHAVSCGLGNSINHFLVEEGYREVQVKNFGVGELFVAHGSHKQLSRELGLTSEQITTEIVAAIENHCALS